MRARQLARRTLPALAAALLLLTSASCVPLPRTASEGLFVSSPDGSNVRLVATAVAEPSWSPDGTRLAFASGDGIYVVAAAAGDPVRVGGGGQPGVPSWSPDGRRLAFVDRAGGRLVVQPVDGSPARTYPMLDDAPDGRMVALTVRNRPEWAPDGRQIAFVSWDGHGDELFVVDLDGTSRRQVTRTVLSAEPISSDDPTGPRKAQSDAGFPSWWPGGGRIAFALYPETAGSPGGVYVTSPDRPAQQRLVGLAPRWGPLWSPDATSILFVANRNGQSDLYLYRTDRRTLSNLTAKEGAPVQSASWSPDGQHVVYAAAGDLYRLDREDGTITKIVDSPYANATPSWSPDGSLIAFSREIDRIRR